MSDILEKKNLNSLYGKMLSEQIVDKVFILYEEYGNGINIYGIYTTKEKAKIEYDNVMKYRLINGNLFYREVKVDTFIKKF